MTETESLAASHELGAVPQPSVNKAAVYAVIALLLAIPCIWQRHVQANDLSSHLYNAWLVNQVAAGHLPGLYVVPQYTNVLFDILLAWLLKSGSVILAERIAVILAVQVFFWGAFVLISVLRGKPAWAMAPFLVLFAYGSVFRMGFFNFYVSAGLSLWAIAIAWSKKPRVRWLAIPLLAAAATAHLLPTLWAAAVLGYVLAARRMPPGRRWWPPALAAAAVAGLAVWLAISFPSRWAPGIRVDSMFGAAQLLIYGMKFKIVATALLCAWIWLLVRRFDMARAVLDEPVFHLWLLNAAACLVLPDAVRVPFYAGSISFLTLRLSLLSAILFCAVIARTTAHPADRFIAAAILLAFMGCSFWDERTLNSIEQEAARALNALPPGARVISTFQDSGLNPWALEHVLDRTCIGRCYDFGNYEPSTTQFRLRAAQGNPYVISDFEEIGELEHDQFAFRRTDFDLYRVSLCPKGRGICAFRVHPGERLVKEDLSTLAAWRGAAP